MNYKGVEITKNEKSGKFYLLSPVNGTWRIFKTLEMAKNYIDKADVIDSKARAMGW